MASVRIGDPPDLAILRAWLAEDPGLRFKLDPSPGWDDRIVGELAHLGCVDIIDLKGSYRNLTVAVEPETRLYRRVIEGLPDAWIEDPALEPGNEGLLARHRDRITWDEPIHSIADIEALPWRPRMLNVKPARFGSLRALLDTYDYCKDHGIGVYGGGMFEQGPGRGQLQYLASLFHPDTPNDIAPPEYNLQGPVAGRPRAPLAPEPHPTGFRWGAYDGRRTIRESAARTTRLVCPPWGPERALLLIADIGGYTEYMRTHRMSLAHAEVNTARLLEAVIDAADEFELIEIEGDAAFLSRQADTLDAAATAAALTQAVAGMHHAFHRERQYVASNLCPCDGCEQAEQSEAEVCRARGRGRDPDDQRSPQARRDRRHPGPPAAEELRSRRRSTCSSPRSSTATAATPLTRCSEVEQELEGIGRVRTYFAGHHGRRGLTAPDRRIPAGSSGSARTLDVAGRGMPYMLGLRRPTARRLRALNGRRSLRVGPKSARRRGRRPRPQRLG